MHLSREQVEIFYDVHKGAPVLRRTRRFYDVGAGCSDGIEQADAVPHLREFIGPTNSNEAPAGSMIRGDFGTDVQCNAVRV